MSRAFEKKWTFEIKCYRILARVIEPVSGIGKGVGEMLLEKVEREAKLKGAKMIHLDTFDFQAKGFYKKHGYSVFGKLEDCPENHCRYYMKKSL